MILGHQQVVPPIAKRRLRLFLNYLKFYFRRNFHGLHVLRLAPFEPLDSLPLLVCMNHPSWWDPIMALYLSNSYFPDRSHYGPIEIQGVSKYKFLEKLGFFPIDKHSRSGAAQFLRVGRAVLSSARYALWVTPQGDFTDVRLKPVILRAGVGHLAHRAERFAMLPLAFEYTYWNERHSEAFACFGRPMIVQNGLERRPDEWTSLFSAALESTQDALAAKAQSRDMTQFESVFSGRAGVGGVYDLWRAAKARLQGKPWQPEHGGVHDH